MSADTPTERGKTTPFHDLNDYVAIPRVAALRLSPDGSWLAAAVQTLSQDRKKYLTSIWRIDPQGGSARRLTWSAQGEAGPRFLPDGSLLFTSRRPSPEAGKTGRDGGSGDAAALWLLPSGGGEARMVAALPGGVAAAEVAGQAGTVAITSPVLPAAGMQGNGLPAAGMQGGGLAPAGSAADDARLRKEREDAGVTAILHESVPVRFWDHDLGPDQLRLFAVDPDRLADAGPGTAGDEAAPGAGGDGAAAYAGIRDLTPDPGRALEDVSFQLTPDGSSVVTGWWQWDPVGESHSELAVIDVATGKRRTLLDAPEFDFETPCVSPDGRLVACLRHRHDTREHPAQRTLVVLGIDGPDASGAAGESGRDLLAGLDRWPDEWAWSHDSRAMFVAADDDGRRPVFRVDVETGEITRVTSDNAAYTELNPAPDGRFLYALRSAVDSPPTPVRIDLATGADPAPLACPGVLVALPGRLEEAEVTVDDGQRVRSWLVLPETASASSPAPLLLWVHGGPLSSWNAWSWRWNPWLMAARGYAVLLPDPALSTGYGEKLIARGHKQWGARTFADVMAATESVLGRPDIDSGKVGMMGGSYGGYMANWIAGHTDRFDAIVSHAGLWALDQMFGTTDHPMFWRPQFGDPLTEPEMYELNSPHRHIAKVRTPMLVIHGNKDYRVPVGEALRLWWDLSRYGVEAKFLYFPDENHWILSPGNARIWYETIFAFLAQHLLGEEWERPALL